VRALVPVLAVAVLPQCLHIENVHVTDSLLHQSRAVDIKSFKEVMPETDIAEPLYQKQTKHKKQ